VSENGVIKTVLCLNAGELVAQIAAKLNLNLSQNTVILTKVVEHCNTAAWFLRTDVAVAINLLVKEDRLILLEDFSEIKGFGIDLNTMLPVTTSLGGITASEFIKGWKVLLDNYALKLFRQDFQMIQSAATLEKFNLFINMGAANKLDFVLLHRYTVNGDFLLIPSRKPVLEPLNLPPLGEQLGSQFNIEAWKGIEFAMDKLKLTSRLYPSNQFVFRGITLPIDQFELLFGTGSPLNIPIKGFLSFSESLELAKEFSKRSLNWYNASKIRIIFKTKAKQGISINDFSDWGAKLGPLRHTKIDEIPVQIQKEVLLKEGYFQKVPGSLKKLPYQLDGIDVWEVELVELGEKFRNL
jgi:hypothetical protein